MSTNIPRALTIAGSDSGGGAGIQADLKTFTALNVYGMSVLTSVTAQNTQAVLGISDLSPDFVEMQIDAVLGDIGTDAVKTGMLSNKDIISSVVRKINQYGVEKLVIDPVMIAKSGDRLLKEEAESVLIRELIPLAYVVTPNIPEAEIISGIKISSLDDMKAAAIKIKGFGSENVLVKGGHLNRPEDSIDILYDGTEFHEYKALRVKTKNTHGTGCTYSAAICAGLANGLAVLDAIEVAKEYVTRAIRSAFDLGKGHGPLNHFWKFQ